MVWTPQGFSLLPASGLSPQTTVNCRMWQDLVSLLGTLCFWICFPNIGYGSRTQHAHIIVVLALLLGHKEAADSFKVQGLIFMARLGSTVAAFVTDSLSDSGKLSVACIRTAVLAGGASCIDWGCNICRNLHVEF